MLYVFINVYIHIISLFIYVIFSFPLLRSLMHAAKSMNHGVLAFDAHLSLYIYIYICTSLSPSLSIHIYIYIYGRVCSTQVPLQLAIGRPVGMPHIPNPSKEDRAVYIYIYIYREREI